MHTSSAAPILDDANDDADADSETFRAVVEENGSLRRFDADVLRELLRSAVLDSRSRALSLYPTEEAVVDGLLLLAEVSMGFILLLVLLSLPTVIKCLE